MTTLPENKQEKQKSFYLNAIRIMMSVISGPIITTPIFYDMVSSSVDSLVEKYLTKSITIPERKNITDRANEAIQRIDEASKIMVEIKSELITGTSSLSTLRNEIQVQKGEANHYANLASINKELASSLTIEMNKIVAVKIQEGLDRGKRRRLICSVIVTVFTLLVGSVLGAYVQIWIQTGSISPVIQVTPLP